jgi:hypothetical protein
MAKTDVKINRSECRIGDNVFFLIGNAYLALERAGHNKLADEMQNKIDAEAESPGEVLKIVKEYVIIV